MLMLSTNLNERLLAFPFVGTNLTQMLLKLPCLVKTVYKVCGEGANAHITFYKA
jgi:hypothetical protein